LAKTFIQSLRRIEEMKKLIAIFAILIFAAPAFAADWAFYGSSRFTTFYTVRERSAFENEDTDLNHSLQTNSRLGANVKADKIQGGVELALRSTDAGDNAVNTRAVFARWNYADNMYLKVGKYQNIIDQTGVSNQVFGGDNDLTGLVASGRRTDQIELGIGNFQLAFVRPTTSNALVGNPGPPPIGTTTDQVTNDAKIPRIEAAYTLPIGNMFKLVPTAGFQWIETASAFTAAPGVPGDKEDLYSYVVGLQLYATIGAFYAKGAAFYGQNMFQANWAESGLGQINNFGAAGWKSNGDIEDTTSYGGGGELGLNFTDTIAFGAGGGIRQDDNDAAFSGKEHFYNVYANMTYKFAPNCKITPEVGYVANQDSFTDGRSGGYDWYAGLQWRLDF
jgi:hypothetical protein